MNEPDFDFDMDEPSFELDTSEFDENVKQFRKRTKEIQERGSELKKGMEIGFARGQEVMTTIHNDWKKWVLLLGAIAVFALLMNNWRWIVLVIIFAAVYFMAKRRATRA